MGDAPDQPAEGSQLWCEAGLGMGAIGQVCLAVWQGEVTPERHARQREVLRSVVERHPGTAVFICVVLPGCPPPDDAMRNATVEMVRSHGDRLRAIACVIAGHGFHAALTRNVLAAMALMIEVKPAIKFVTDFQEATLWIARHCDAPPELTQAYKQLLAHLSEARRSGAGGG